MTYSCLTVELRNVEGIFPLIVVVASNAGRCSCSCCCLCLRQRRMSFAMRGCRKWGISLAVVLCCIVLLTPMKLCDTHLSHSDGTPQRCLQCMAAETVMESMGNPGVEFGEGVLARLNAENETGLLVDSMRRSFVAGVRRPTPRAAPSWLLPSPCDSALLVGLCTQALPFLQPPGFLSHPW